MDLRNFRIGIRLGLGFGMLLVMLVSMLVTNSVVGAKNDEKSLGYAYGHRGLGPGPHRGAVLPRPRDDGSLT